MLDTINIKNKKGSFNYQFLDNYIAGIMLLGTEIKSIRNGDVNFIDSYCTFINNELWLSGLHIAQYEFGERHEEKRNRKLLLTKTELKKLFSKYQQSGLTIVPVRLFVNDKGLCKVEIALAKGKKTFDKRADLKEKDIKREIERER
jgi:SsrA-binding protein